MSGISAEMVKQLREKTGAGMMDCKSALVEAGGSIEKAVELLRKRGLKDIEKRAGKVAAEGTLGVYVHSGDQVAAFVELNCETDFVARNDEFRALAKDIAMHVAAMRPQYLSVEEIPQEVLEREKEIFVAQLSPEQHSKLDKILPGKWEKWYEESVLLHQPFIKDDSGKKKIKEIVDELGIKFGEKIAVRRFSRIQVGEGIEKQQTDYVAEVAAAVAGQ